MTYRSLLDVGANHIIFLSLLKHSEVFYLSRVMGQVLGVSISAALTQSLLARNLRAIIVGPGSADVCESTAFYTPPDAFRQTIVKILASTEYIHTLSRDLQKKASTSWFQALHIVFCCQLVRPHNLFALC